MIMSLSKQSTRAIAPPNLGHDLTLRRIAEFSHLLGPQLLRPMSMVEAVNVKAHGYSLVSNKECDSLSEKTSPKNGSGMVWTGTLVISEREGKAFGEVVRVVADFASPYNFIFEVPSGFRGKRGCLVLEYPDFEFEPLDENTYRIRPIGWLAHVEGFPSVIGWFRVEQNFGLPIGEALRESSDTSRFLDILNREFCAHISLVSRDLGSRNRIHVAARPSEKFRPLARFIITPENYINHVLEILQKSNGDREIKRFIYDWMGSDPVLAAGINRARLNQLIENE